MDTSEIYIKMCNCEEVQWLWEPEEGDWFYVDLDDDELEARGVDSLTHWIYDNREKSIYWNKFDEDAFMLVDAGEFKRNELIWLPRQDQMQKLIQDNLFEYDNGDNKIGCGTDCLLDSFISFVERFTTDIEPHDIDPFSMEKLWLMFYMAEEHNLIWDFNNEHWKKYKDE